MIAAAAAVAAVAGPPGTRIFGGHRARRGQFPYQVSIRVNFTGAFEHNCGGSIISDRYIVTAAHCFLADFPHDMTRYRLLVGAHNRSGDGEEYRFARNHIHPGWDLKRIIHDIALAQTDRAIGFTKRVQPIVISREFIRSGLRAVTSGWGRTDVSNYNRDRERGNGCARSELN